MSRRRVVLAACLAVLLWPVRPSAHASPTDPIPSPTARDRDVSTPASLLATLQITAVLLEAPPAETPQPSTVLRFDLRNDGDHSVTDVVIEIAVRERPVDESTTSRVLVAPFTISGHATVAAGYIVNYQMLLRNLAAECTCVADVRVVSAREVHDVAD